MHMQHLFFVIFFAIIEIIPQRKKYWTINLTVIIILRSLVQFLFPFQNFKNYLITDKKRAKHFFRNLEK